MGRTGERGGAYRVLVGKLREKYHLENLGVDGKIVLKSVYNGQYGAVSWLMWLGIGTSDGIF